MKTGGILLMILEALFLIATGGTNGSDQACLDLAERQLDVLTLRMVSLSNKLDGVIKDWEHAEFHGRRLARKLDHQEGKKGACKLGYFPCDLGQYGAVQCVRDYLVCDGSADCKNGADEVDDVCKYNIWNYSPGQLMASGLVLYDHCEPASAFGGIIAQNQINTIHMHEVDIIPWFPSRPKVTWLWTAPFQSSLEQHNLGMLVVGTFDYVTRSMPIDTLYGSVHYTNEYEELGMGKVHIVCKGRRLFSDEVCFVNILDIQ